MTKVEVAIWVGAVVAVIIQLLDIYTTHWIIAHGGYEKAPLMKALMKRFGLIPALYGFKLLLCAVVVFATYKLLPEYDYYLYGSLPILIAISLKPVVHNFKVMKRMR